MAGQREDLLHGNEGHSPAGRWEIYLHSVMLCKLIFTRLYAEPEAALLALELFAQFVEHDVSLAPRAVLWEKEHPAFDEWAHTRSIGISLVACIAGVARITLSAWRRDNAPGK